MGPATAVGMRIAALVAATMAIAKGMVRYLTWRTGLLDRVQAPATVAEPKPRPEPHHSLEAR
jgi:hypothetical protein